MQIILLATVSKTDPVIGNFNGVLETVGIVTAENDPPEVAPTNVSKSRELFGEPGLRRLKLSNDRLRPHLLGCYVILGERKPLLVSVDGLISFCDTLSL